MTKKMVIAQVTLDGKKADKRPSRLPNDIGDILDNEQSNAGQAHNYLLGIASTALHANLYRPHQVSEGEKRDVLPDLSKLLQDTDTSILLVDEEHRRAFYTGYRRLDQENASESHEYNRRSGFDPRALLTNHMLPTERGVIRGDPTRTLARPPSERFRWWAYSFSQTLFWCDRRHRLYGKH